MSENNENFFEVYGNELNNEINDHRNLENLTKEEQINSNIIKNETTASDIMNEDSVYEYLI
jgi:hypothetical protein